MLALEKGHTCSGAKTGFVSQEGTVAGAAPQKLLGQSLQTSHEGSGWDEYRLMQKRRVEIFVKGLEKLEARTRQPRQIKVLTSTPGS